MPQVKEINYTSFWPYPEIQPISQRRSNEKPTRTRLIRQPNTQTNIVLNSDSLFEMNPKIIRNGFSDLNETHVGVVFLLVTFEASIPHLNEDHTLLLLEKIHLGCLISGQSQLIDDVLIYLNHMQPSMTQYNCTNKVVLALKGTIQAVWAFKRKKSIEQPHIEENQTRDKSTFLPLLFVIIIIIAAFVFYLSLPWFFNLVYDYHLSRQIPRPYTFSQYVSELPHLLLYQILPCDHLFLSII